MAGGMLRVAMVTLAVVTALAPRPRAVEANLTTQGVDDAIVFARMAGRGARQEFHDRYARAVGAAPVNRISIVSEYRRVVLRAEEHIRLGDRNYSVRQMTSDLNPWRGLLEVIVELSFHPQNTYVGVPLIDVLLVPLDSPATAMPLIADATDRIPRFGLFWNPLAARRAVVALPAGVHGHRRRQGADDRRLGAGAVRGRNGDRWPLRRDGEGRRQDARVRRLRLRRPALTGGARRAVLVEPQPLAPAPSP